MTDFDLLSHKNTPLFRKNSITNESKNDEDVIYVDHDDFVWNVDTNELKDYGLLEDNYSDLDGQKNKNSFKKINNQMTPRNISKKSLDQKNIMMGDDKPLNYTDYIGKNAIYNNNYAFYDVEHYNKEKPLSKGNQFKSGSLNFFNSMNSNHLGSDFINGNFTVPKCHNEIENNNNINIDQNKNQILDDRYQHYSLLNNDDVSDDNNLFLLKKTHLNAIEEMYRLTGKLRRLWVKEVIAIKFNYLLFCSNVPPRGVNLCIPINIIHSVTKITTKKKKKSFNTDESGNNENYEIPSDKPDSRVNTQLSRGHWHFFTIFYAYYDERKKRVNMKEVNLKSQTAAIVNRWVKLINEAISRYADPKNSVFDVVHRKFANSFLLKTYDRIKKVALNHLCMVVIYIIRNNVYHNKKFVFEILSNLYRKDKIIDQQNAIKKEKHFVDLYFFANRINLLIESLLRRYFRTLFENSQKLNIEKKCHEIAKLGERIIIENEQKINTEYVRYRQSLLHSIINMSKFKSLHSAFYIVKYYNCIVSRNIINIDMRDKVILYHVFQFLKTLHIERNMIVKSLKSMLNTFKEKQIMLGFYRLKRNSESFHNKYIVISFIMYSVSLIWRKGQLRYAFSRIYAHGVNHQITHAMVVCRQMTTVNEKLIHSYDMTKLKISVDIINNLFLNQFRKSSFHFLQYLRQHKNSVLLKQTVMYAFIQIFEYVRKNFLFFAFTQIKSVSLRVNFEFEKKFIGIKLLLQFFKSYEFDLLRKVYHQFLRNISNIARMKQKHLLSLGLMNKRTIALHRFVQMIDFIERRLLFYCFVQLRNYYELRKIYLLFHTLRAIKEVLYIVKKKLFVQMVYTFFKLKKKSVNHQLFPNSECSDNKSDETRIYHVESDQTLFKDSVNNIKKSYSLPCGWKLMMQNTKRNSQPCSLSSRLKKSMSCFFIVDMKKNGLHNNPLIKFPKPKKHPADRVKSGKKKVANNANKIPRKSKNDQKSPMTTTCNLPSSSVRSSTGQYFEYVNQISPPFNSSYLSNNSSAEYDNPPYFYSHSNNGFYFHSSPPYQSGSPSYYSAHPNSIISPAFLTDQLLYNNNKYSSQRANRTVENNAHLMKNTNSCVSLFSCCSTSKQR